MTPIELNAALAYADFLDQHLPEIAGCPAGNAVRALVEEIGRLGNEIKQLRAIPSDRVLGEGMAALRRFAERCAQRDHQPDEHIGSAKCVACEAEDALRANQGGK